MGQVHSAWPEPRPIPAGPAQPLPGSPPPPVPLTGVATGASPAGPPRRRLPGEDKVDPSPRRLGLLPTYLHSPVSPPRSTPLSPLSVSATHLTRAPSTPWSRHSHGHLLPRTAPPCPYSPSASSTPPTPSAWSQGATERPHRRLLPPWPGSLRQRFAPASSPPSPLCSPAGHGEPLPSPPPPPFSSTTVPRSRHPSCGRALLHGRSSPATSR